MVALTGFAIGASQASLAPVIGKEQGAQRAEARAIATQQKEAGDLKLARDRIETKRAQDLEGLTTDYQRDMMQAMQLTIEKQGSAQLRQSSYHATKGWIEDGDIRHLQNFIKDSKDNPYAPQEFHNIVRVDKLNPKGPEHQQLVNSLNLSDEQHEELDAMDGTRDGQIDWDIVSKRFVVMTRPDGSQDLRDVYNFGIMSGYADWASNEELRKFEALAKLRKGGSGGQETTLRRNADHVAAARTRIEAGEGTKEDYSMVEGWEAQVGGTTVFAGSEANKARDAIDNSDFFEMDPNVIAREATPKTRAMMDQVRAIEKQTKLSTKDKEIVAQAVSDITSFKRAINLDPNDRGPVAAYMTGLKKYFREDGGGNREALAAYNSWMNTVRNEMFGVALSVNEIKMFNKAYGTDKQAMTVALYGMRELASSLEGSLNAAALQNDPRVTHVRFGHTREQLREGLENVKSRIAFYEAFEQARSAGKSVPQAVIDAKAAANVEVDSQGRLSRIPQWNFNPSKEEAIAADDPSTQDPQGGQTPRGSVTPTKSLEDHVRSGEGW